MRKTRQRVRFANVIEQNFALLLQRLRLRWQYEPHTFVLRTKPDGTPALAFTPDFYVPDLGMYFELTTLRQKLVTLKNRKARLLTEQRPDVRVRLLYRRDCQEIIRPARTRKARAALLRKLHASPPEETLRRADWLVYLRRTGDAAGCIGVLGVRLPLAPEWGGRRLHVWVYPGAIEVDSEECAVARFPCSYDISTRTLRWVEPGEILGRPGIEQARLALPELERRPAGGSTARRRGLRGSRSSQLPLPL